MSIDSFLGALFQYSGYDEKTGMISYEPSSGVRHISGRDWLNNHQVLSFWLSCVDLSDAGVHRLIL
jgi:hypothetical protein